MFDYVYNRDKDQFSKKYFCYIIKPNEALPVFVNLGFQIEFDSLVKINHGKFEHFYNFKNSIEFINLFLKPVLDKLAGINRLIISPVGSLNNINFSLLPIDTNKVFGEKYDIRLITNSFSLLENKTALKPDILYLYGGLDYDSNNAKVQRTINNTFELGVAKAAPEYILNYKWAFLDGSLNEVNSIASLVQKKQPQLKVQKLTGQLGTESAFRSLNYSKPFIFHLATHGFSVPTPYTNQRSENLRTKIGKLPEAGSPKSKTILYSGFVLSGANLASQSSSNVSNDGVVLAEDINLLNFTNCELLVLSACKTGIGSIKNNEGVFGLGRAFKISGVKNIIVSQWEIPDKETSELFSLFYEELFKGENYRSALLNAQLTMKSRYKDPYLWAGFLLIE
jgi:CHAT domain-containing protein